LKLDRIVVAVDNSNASREAARCAARIATLCGGELTVLAVAPGAGAPGANNSTPLDLIEASLGGNFFDEFPSLPIDLAGVHGLPQIEIGRYAEHRKADLIVLGRKERTRSARLFLGDTADAVLRRSRIPCLVVPPGLVTFSHLMAAVDGTDRGFAVYEYAVAFAHACAMDLNVVTVEPQWTGEPPALSKQVWSTRTEKLAALIGSRTRRGGKAGPGGGVCATDNLLHVRYGEAVGEIVAEVAEVGSDVLVLGFHRGGPPLVVSASSVSRKLVHAAPCAVLSVPF
jgi:nucleotide-binding universal stress UspA family protein